MNVDSDVHKQIQNKAEEIEFVITISNLINHARSELPQYSIYASFCKKI